MNNLLIVILTPLLTILGNILFYFFVKGNVDKKINEHNTAYSGVFKEKIDIYRELLERTYDIKKELLPLFLREDDEKYIEIEQMISDYVRFFSVNRPFLSNQISKELITIKEEFKDISKAFQNYSHHNEVATKAWLDAGKRLYTNNSFEEIESKLISEMKHDLKTII